MFFFCFISLRQVTPDLHQNICISVSLDLVSLVGQYFGRLVWFVIEIGLRKEKEHT